MTYSAAGFLALIIHLIINQDVLRKDKADSSADFIPAHQSYRAYLVCVAVFYVVDAVWGFVYSRHWIILAYANTNLFFITMALSVLFWTRFVVDYMSVGDKKDKPMMIVGNFIFLFQLTILIINFFKPIVFSFDEEGVYHPGPARNINLIIQSVLFVMTAIHAFVLASKNKDSFRRRRHVIGLFSVIMAGFVIAQMFNPLFPCYAIGCLLGGCLLHSFVLENLKEEYRGNLEVQLQESEEKSSKFDLLTGLPNMTYFFELCEPARRVILGRGDLPVMLYMDFSGMKFFNNKYGFAEGDKLLKNFADILLDLFGGDYCCRIGGDHFAAVSQRKGLEPKLNQLLQECKDMQDVEALPLHVGIYSDPEGKDTASIACDRAKLACNELQGTYASSYKYYNKDLSDDIESRHYVVENIDRAIEERWIHAYYQPIVRATNRKVCEEEALARWIDPERGVLSPAEFIPALEHSGQIYKLDLYMLDEILKKIQRQKELGIITVPHSINLSRSDFDACDIVQEICTRVDEAGVSRDLITIEITESMVGSDFDFIKEQIGLFHEQGFPVWMDDFGSGYSSLEMLQSLQFDLIKFDMGFLRKLDEGESGKIILRELMQMATALGLDTICEGVETEEQVWFLQEIGCSKLQGYYFRKPISFEEIQERNRKGTQIGNENPDEFDYFDAIGRVNLYDLTSVVNEEEITDNYTTLPSCILEVKDKKGWYMRSNQSYREFLIQHFDRDFTNEVLELDEPNEENSISFIRAIDRCCEVGGRQFFDEVLPDGSKAHSFARTLSRNPVTGRTAIAIAVLSVREPEEGATYAEIARALAVDYYNIYVIDLDTNGFIEYTVAPGKNELAVERHGIDFFESAKRDTMTRIYEEDRQPFLDLFSKDKVIQEIDAHGVFTTTYRLIDTGSPVYVNMKITRLYPGSNRVILGVSIIESQMKQQEEYEKTKQERLALGRVMALSEGYLALYSIDPETGNYIEFSASDSYNKLGFAKEGEDFFEKGIADGKRTLCPDDLPGYLEKFTRDNVLSTIRKKGKFSLRYRLMIDGEEHPVCLRIAESDEEDKTRLIAGVREVSD